MREGINKDPLGFTLSVVETIRPLLGTTGNTRRRYRALVKSSLYRSGYYNKAYFKGPSIREIDPMCADFLDPTKDPE